MRSGITLQEMSAEIIRQNALKADYVIDTRRLNMAHDSSGTLLQMTDENSVDIVEPMEINSTAHRQIATFTGMRFILPAKKSCQFKLSTL